MKDDKIWLRTINRFYDKIFYSPDGCWYWTGSTFNTGYGKIGFRLNHISSHRLSYIIHNGEIINGLQVLHRCDNRLCVNPNHLFLGTIKDNMKDMVLKGRQNKAKGENHGHSKLTNNQVLEIRSSNEYQKDIAKKYGVTQQTISRIKNHVNYK
jgi:hypothetical protein